MKKDLIRIIVALLVFVVAIFTDYDLIFIVGYILIGYDVILNALRNIKNGQIFDENFLMTIATFGALYVKEYPEAMAVMLFYQIGEFFQMKAVNNSRKSISELMDIRPDYAFVKEGDKIVEKDPFDVEIGDLIVVRPGEKVPLDGIVVEGHSTLDTKALTGESLPRDIDINDEIFSGFVNLNGLLTIKVTKEYSDSTVSKILDLVENASNKKSNSEKFITKFAKYYTPIVVFLALALAIIPPLVIPNQEFTVWMYRACSFLVVSCPCALVISVPLSFFAGIGGASKQGILVKGSNYLEELSRINVMVFDKTGTLTKGEFNVHEIHSLIDQEELLKIAATTEHYSSHPIAESLKKAYGKKPNLSVLSDLKEIPGKGVQALYEGKEVLVGNNKLMKDFNIPYEECDIYGTIVYVALDHKYLGNIVIRDDVKEDSAETIKNLKEIGIKKTVMLTGDNDIAAHKINDIIQVDEVHSNLLPHDKVAMFEKIKASTDDKVAYVGDGINDAPVLAMSDVGISMGGLGSDAAIEASDIVIMSDELSKINTAIKIAKKTLRLVEENIFFAIGVKVLVLILVAFGKANMWAAVFADVGVSVIAILNATRALDI